MTLHLLDHVLAAAYFVIFPAAEVFSLRKLGREIAAGNSAKKIKLYKKTIVEEWIQTLIVFGLWYALSRSVSSLGLIAPRSNSWLGHLIAGLFLLLILVQIWYVLKSAEQQQAVKQSLGESAFMVPQNLKELKLFAWVGVTAGICEEILFRGFLTLYLQTLLGVPLAVALVLSTVFFGFAHLYLGVAGALRAFFMGGFFALVYGLTGSLLAPIVLHIAVDLSSGFLTYKTFTADNAPLEQE